MIAALSLLTCVGRGAQPTPQAARWFGFVGALMGALIAGSWWLGLRWWSPLLAAVVVVVVDAVLTGMLHLDGLADSGDGLLAPLDRDRRLAAMKDPNIGAFGVITVVLVLLVEVAALASLPFVWWLVPVVWATSRSIVAVALVRMPYARPGGLAGRFRADGGDPVVLVVAGLAIVAAVAVAGMADGAPGVVVIAAAVVGGVAVLALAHRRLGGFTGDVLGAAIVLSQTAAVLAAASVLHP